MKACRISSSVVSLTLGLHTTLRWVAQFTPPAALRLGKNPLPVEEEAKWSQSRYGCVRRESLPATNGTPAHSVVMYRLPHPGRCCGDCMTHFICPLFSFSLSCLYHCTFPVVFLLILSRCISFRVSLYVISFLPPLLYLYSVLAVYFLRSLFYLLCLAVYLVPFLVGWWCTDVTTFVSTTPAWRNTAVFLLIILRVSFVCLLHALSNVNWLCCTCCSCQGCVFKQAPLGV
jgi:hypothetical protein